MNHFAFAGLVYGIHCTRIAEDFFSLSKAIMSASHRTVLLYMYNRMFLHFSNTTSTTRSTMHTRIHTGTQTHAQTHTYAQ